MNGFFLALDMHCKYNLIDKNKLTCISPTLRKLEIQCVFSAHYQRWALVCAPNLSSQGHAVGEPVFSPFPFFRLTVPVDRVRSVRVSWIPTVRNADSSLSLHGTALGLERDWWTPVHLCQNLSSYSSFTGSTGAQTYLKKTSPEPAVQCLDERKLLNWPIQGLWNRRTREEGICL